jgi:AcrR family transcriptional regulator
MSDGNAPPEKPAKRLSREAILDAAEALIREQGVNRMTLDAVAAKAGLSKGGLLYNFPSKDALLKGMIERVTRRLHQPGDGPVAARMIANRLALESEKAGDRRTGQGMLAAIAEKPDLLDPIRTVQRKVWSDIKAEVADPQRALIAWLAAEGLCFLDMFDTSPLSEDERAAVVRAIRAMAGDPPSD